MICQTDNKNATFVSTMLINGGLLRNIQRLRSCSPVSFIDFDKFSAVVILQGCRANEDPSLIRINSLSYAGTSRISVSLSQDKSFVVLRFFGSINRAQFFIA